jgi:hypothetical protein
LCTAPNPSPRLKSRPSIHSSRCGADVERLRGFGKRPPCRPSVKYRYLTSLDNRPPPASVRRPERRARLRVTRQGIGLNRPGRRLLWQRGPMPMLSGSPPSASLTRDSRRHFSAYQIRELCICPVLPVARIYGGNRWIILHEMVGLLSHNRNRPNDAGGAKPARQGRVKSL